MRPAAVLIGIVLGSSVGITVSLTVVLFLYLLMGGDNPEMRRETPALLRHTAIFLGFTVIAAAAFYGTLLRRRWQWPAVAAMLVAIAGLTGYYWP